MQIDSCKSEGRWVVWGPLQQMIRGLCPFSTGMQTSFLPGLSNVSCTRHPCPLREDSAGIRGSPEMSVLLKGLLLLWLRFSWRLKEEVEEET